MIQRIANREHLRGLEMGAKDAKDVKDANRPNGEPTCFYLSKQEAHRFLDNSSQQVPQGISRTNTTNK